MVYDSEEVDGSDEDVLTINDDELRGEHDSQHEDQRNNSSSSNVKATTLNPSPSEEIRAVTPEIRGDSRTRSHVTTNYNESRKQTYCDRA